MYIDKNGFKVYDTYKEYENSDEYETTWGAFFTPNVIMQEESERGNK
jgi:hypothetical protein